MTLSADAAFRKDRADGYGRLEHRHFATIAAIINKRVTEPLGGHEAKYIANAFADELARTNPRFDRERFLKACGV